MDAFDGCQDFLDQSGWGDAQRIVQRADFSSRRYARLVKEGKTAYLMQADQSQKPGLFIAMADLLRALEISTPQIYAQDLSRGLVLMEDFGDENFGRLLDNGATAEPLYQRGLDALVHLHNSFTLDKTSTLGLPVFDASLFAAQVGLFLDGYWPMRKGAEADTEVRSSFLALWQNLLTEATAGPQTLLLRDYIPDNLMSLPLRHGWRNVGVLDFQDGGIGPEAYDVISLAECVRRDGNATDLDDTLSAYVWQRKVKDRGAFERAAAILATQRAMRTLGNVARRPEKRTYLPRIERFLRDMMTWREAVKPVAAWCQEYGILV